MNSTKLLVAVAVTVFFVVGLPGAVAAENVTPADGSATATTQVTDAGTGSGPAAPCYVNEDGEVVCICDDYGPLCK